MNFPHSGLELKDIFTVDNNIFVKSTFKRINEMEMFSTTLCSLFYKTAGENNNEGSLNNVR